MVLPWLLREPVFNASVSIVGFTDIRIVSRSIGPVRGSSNLSPLRIIREGQPFSDKSSVISEDTWSETFEVLSWD